jgi:hypothetical protein
MGVVNDAVRAGRPDQLHVLRTAHAGHPRTKRSGDLHGENPRRPHPSAGAPADDPWREQQPHNGLPSRRETAVAGCDVGWRLGVLEAGAAHPQRLNQFRAMSERASSTVTEAPGSHSIHLSQLASVAALITQAVAATRG